MPRPIDCNKTAPPRSTGSFKIGALSLHFGSAAAVLTIVPSALRTAIAYALGVRIITPSITAWPPTIRSLSLVLIVSPVSPLPLGEGKGEGVVSAAQIPHPNPLPKGEGARHHGSCYIQLCRRFLRL